MNIKEVISEQSDATEISVLNRSKTASHISYAINLHVPNFSRPVFDKNNKTVIDDGNGKLILANTKLRLTKFSVSEMAMMKSNTTKQLEREIEMIVDKKSQNVSIPYQQTVKVCDFSFKREKPQTRAQIGDKILE